MSKKSQESVPSPSRQCCASGVLLAHQFSQVSQECTHGISEVESLFKKIIFVFEEEEGEEEEERKQEAAERKATGASSQGIQGRGLSQEQDAEDGLPDE